MKKGNGFVYIFTGEGKGKTSAALGTAVRALANGWRVGWIAFYKEAQWNMSEHQLSAMLRPKWSKNLEMKLLGKGFYIAKPETTLKTTKSEIKIASVGKNGVVVDDDAAETHLLAAQATLAEVESMLDRKKNRPDVLVLDEVCNAISDGLIVESRVVQLLEKRGKTHVVLTGRNASNTLIKAADLVSSIEKVKHPYDSGRLAVKGLDY